MTLCDSAQYVHYLSPTESGRQHDKKVADEYALRLPAGCVLRQDLGLLGHAPAGVVVEMPHKKLPKRELTFSHKLYNRMLSPLRVVIEHAHSGIKRLHMVQGIIRLRGEWVRDTVMVVACGLHNLRVRSPHRAYRALRWSGRNGHGESNFPLSGKQQNQSVNGREPSRMRPFEARRSAA